MRCATGRGFAPQNRVGSPAVILRTMAFLAIIIAAVALPAAAGTAVYRCVKDGQTVLTDHPCESDAAVPPPASNPSAAHAAVDQRYVGEWRGQAQYQVAHNGQLTEEAHAVVAVSLGLSADGKVSGGSPDNGCTLLGTWSPGTTARLAQLEITLSGCRYTGLNRRYSGSFIASTTDNGAELSLQAFAQPRPGEQAQSFDVRATLHR